MLLLLCPLVGFSFFQAISLYNEASLAARDQPALAVSLSPFDGVLVPSLGAFYLTTTLLFPFVAIRVLGREMETGAHRLLVQLPYRIATLIGAKLAAVSAAWLLAFIPALCALVFWAMLGGHLHAPETLNLLLGHLLYAGAGRGDRAVRRRDRGRRRDRRHHHARLRSARGSWISLAGQPGFFERVSLLSLTQTLRPFEQGLLSVGLLLGVAAAIGGFAALAGVWLHPGVRLRSRSSFRSRASP